MKQPHLEVTGLNIFFLKSGTLTAGVKAYGLTFCKVSYELYAFLFAFELFGIQPMLKMQFPPSVIYFTLDLNAKYIQM